MALHYLLDGYNIIKQAPRLADLPLDEGRQQFVTWVETASPQGSRRNSVSVFFDGRPGLAGAPRATIRVVFTLDESADDLIKRAVENAKSKADVVVVTEDKGLKLYVRALGARIMAPREFAAPWYAVRTKPGRGKTPSSDPGGKHVSLTQAQKINKELEKIWLK